MLLLYSSKPERESNETQTELKRDSNGTKLTPTGPEPDPPGLKRDPNGIQIKANRTRTRGSN